VDISRMSAFVTPFGALASNFFVSPFLKRVRLCQGSAASSLCTAAYPRTLYSIYSHIWCLYFRGGGAAEPQVGSRRAFELGTVLGAAAWLLKVECTGGGAIRTPPYSVFQ
jgi:hypothetical protein